MKIICIYLKYSMSIIPRNIYILFIYINHWVRYGFLSVYVVVCVCTLHFILCFAFFFKCVSYAYINKTKVSVGGGNDFKKGQINMISTNSWVRIIVLPRASLIFLKII